LSNDKLDNVLKDAVVVYFMTLLHQYPGWIDENHKTTSVRIVVSRGKIRTRDLSNTKRSTNTLHLHIRVQMTVGPVLF
jgi:hypothetical protein